MLPKAPVYLLKVKHLSTLLCCWTHTHPIQLLSLITAEVAGSTLNINGIVCCYIAVCRYRRQLAMWLVDRRQLKGFEAHYSVSFCQQYLDTEVNKYDFLSVALVSFKLLYSYCNML